jgi:hypothetical protein
MDYFWILVTMPVIGIAYLVYVIIRRGEIKFSKSVTRLPRAHPDRIRKIDNRSPERKVKSISEKECERLLRESSDVIFVDLRSEGRTPIPFAVPEVLVLSPGQVFDMLRWLPSSTSIVLYATSNLCASVAWSARNIHGLAHIYVLDQGPAIVGSGMQCSA